MTNNTPLVDQDQTGSIRLSGVTRTYQQGGRAVRALRGVDLTIDDPGFYAIMGPSGSGKSTLLHLLAALDLPDDGSIEVAGQSLQALSETQLTAFRRHRIGIVFQQFNLISTLTALDNVTLPAMLDGQRAAERDARGRELLEMMGLGERLDHRPEALSGGEQQRVAIARSLMFSPKILLADEPTGNLDSRVSRQIWSLLSDLAEIHGHTVLMVTHEPAAAVHCRKVFVLRDGVVDGAFAVDGMDVGELATRALQPQG